MKLIITLVSALGLLGLILAGAEAFLKCSIGSISPGGYLRGSTALFLLALVMMAYGKCYCSKENA